MSAFEISKYDREIHWDSEVYDDIYNAEILINKVICSGWVYEKYLWPAIRELKIIYFQSNGEIRKCNLEAVMKELELLIEWVEVHVEGEDLDYIKSRLQYMQKFIPENLQEDDDVLYIF